MPAPGFHEVRFPDAIARGATGGPEFRTEIAALASGFEQRNANWSAARARFDIGTAIRTREQMAEVIAFFRARKGRAYGFRFRDWTDFDAVDQEMAATSDPLVWQLVKRYVSGAGTDVRTISKPEAGTVVVRVAGVVAAPSVDTTTGRVSFASAPAAVPRADFRFDVPARFDTDHLPVTADSYNTLNVSSIAIIEIRV